MATIMRRPPSTGGRSATAGFAADASPGSVDRTPCRTVGPVTATGVAEEVRDAAGPRRSPRRSRRSTIFGRVVAYKYVVAAVFVSALFLDLLDTTIVNVALRTIGEEFQTEAIEWVVLGYTLALAVWIPASGWMGDRFGTKRVFLTALALFVGGSVLCGLAQTHRPARRVPRRAGRRRRHAHADRHRHAVPRLPADRAGPGVDDRDDPDAGRPGARSGARRACSPTRSAGAGSSSSTSRSASPPWPSGCASCASTPSRPPGAFDVARLRAVRLRAGVDRLRPERGTRASAGPTRRSSGSGIGGVDRLRPARVRRDPHARTRCSPCGCSATGCSGPRNIVMAFAHGQLHRPDVRAAAVPPGPARPRPAATAA